MRPPTRREFLATSSTLAAARLARGDDPKPAPASESITLGFIGVGGMGSGLLNIFKGMPDVRVAAVCDVYEPHALRAKSAAAGKPDTYGDFRRVLDRKDIDAVVVATPDHWHAIPTILACQAGKDVYCEKPLAYRIGEGRAMVDAATKFKRVTQMGNLIHAGENYHRVVEIVRSGVLGTIHKARVWMAGNRAPIGSPVDAAPPPGVDYDLWLGPAPKRPFNSNRFTFNWRYFWDYGGGYLTDFVCHIVDLVHWAMEVDAPSTISATGGRYVTADNAETPDTLEVIYHYPKGDHGFTLVWSQADRSSYAYEGKGLGILFQGTEASLVADYNSFKIIPEKGRTIELPPKTLPRSIGHHREWMDSIKSRGPTSCHFEYGQRLSTVGHLGNISLWTGETLKWDAKSERVTNHPEANAHLTRVEYRAPWSIPIV
jgi:predicted dehydrogenase